MSRPDQPAPTRMLRLYRTAIALAGPLIFRKVAAKLRAHAVPDDRIAERLGQATLPRPKGDLVWFHAASVGESLSVLTLITRLGARHPALSFLITSGTATSAYLIARRLPPRTRHQFAPLDTPRAVAAFYDHWRPRAGIFVESELWPNMLLDGQARGVRLALLNARLSDKSVRGWQKWPATAARVMATFDILIAQNRHNADNLAAMGAMGAPRDRIRTGSNLKSMSAPLPVDPTALTAFRDSLGARPLWVASSTHPGEEETVLAAHKTLLAEHPDLCLLLIPRHPERGDTVARLIADAGLTCARRSTGQTLTYGDAVYLADTLGETGTWYAATPIVFVAGSLRPIGGHNPFEPAQAGAALLTGPHRASFEESYTALIATGAAAEVTDAASLAAAVHRLLTDTATRNTARAAARRFVAGQDAKLDHLIEMLTAALDIGNG